MLLLSIDDHCAVFSWKHRPRHAAALRWPGGPCWGAAAPLHLYRRWRWPPGQNFATAWRRALLPLWLWYAAAGFVHASWQGQPHEAIGLLEAKWVAGVWRCFWSWNLGRPAPFTARQTSKASRRNTFMSKAEELVTQEALALCAFAAWPADPSIQSFSWNIQALPTKCHWQVRQFHLSQRLVAAVPVPGQHFGEEPRIGIESNPAWTKTSRKRSLATTKRPRGEEKKAGLAGGS